MNREWLLAVALVLFVIQPVHGGLIPNGDFETGDFTDWNPAAGGTPGDGGIQTVEFIDGSYRAVIKTVVEAGAGLSGGELLTSSDPLLWGNGKVLQFDASYSYTTDSVGADVFFGVANGSIGLDILHVIQGDATPLSGSSPITTYTMPWGGQAIDILPFVSTQNSGSVSLTVVLDNFRIIPEPSTWVLAATALVGVPCFAARRRRR